MARSVREEVFGSSRIILGDCRDVMPGLGRFDCVVTDVPYGIGADKKKAHRTIRDNPLWEKVDWDHRPEQPTMDLLLGVADVVAIWGGNYLTDMLPVSGGWLAWIKPQAGTGFSLADMELCWTNLSIAARCFQYKRRDGNDHPTQKPVSVMSWTMKFAKGRRVIDPFMGSGTTGVVCIGLGREFTGIEIHEPYFDIACRRMAAAHNELYLFDNQGDE